VFTDGSVDLADPAAAHDSLLDAAISVGVLSATSALAEGDAEYIFRSVFVALG